MARGRGLEGYARRVHFQLNNNLEDAPAINGIQIKELLGLAVPEREGVLAEWRERRRQPRSGPSGGPAAPGMLE